MRVHHLNCISTCPAGGHLMDSRTPGVLTRAHLCCHCLLLETNDGLVLVDTGLGLRDCASPRTRLSAFFLALLKPEFRDEMTAARQVEQLGFKRSDVRHIVLTHLDFDHAGGLDDFPHASVHMTRVERDYALLQKTWLDRQRFRPQQWRETRPQWQVYGEAGGDSWFGFNAVRNLRGLPDDILLVPLPGHTHGHAGVAVRKDDGKWLLQAGDAYFFHREMDIEQPWCTPGLRMYQAMMEKDRKQRLANQRRLRELRHHHGAQVQLCCGHDPIEFERLTGHAMGTPIAQVRGMRPAFS
ncbi:MBL fold metallo-hydrolase [Ramlibacter algicola]|uniref:MBL fold metallo-hydrolase n=1 Tax=Ramlibacter algicola TaxID=2795217 RepID=A0A934Q1P4_9BURK|nr:MBL fold metallo-hydrolase [Ramlibacter algicola]MBK0393271.1 MBL fold metallo-hydrolase [Ramlibacter algicola]